MLLPPEEAQHTEGRTAELTQQAAVLLSVSGPEVLLAERGTQQTAGTMGTPSGPPRRRCIPWNRLLLAGERVKFQGGGRDERTRDWVVSGGDGALRGDRGLLFGPEGRGERSRGGWGEGRSNKGNISIN